jgi:hypothetical protein
VPENSARLFRRGFPEARGCGGKPLIRDSNREHIEGSATDERVAKVFVVTAGGMRKCLICEQEFVRRAAFEHSRTSCYPPSANRNAKVIERKGEA